MKNGESLTTKNISLWAESHITLRHFLPFASHQVYPDTYHNDYMLPLIKKEGIQFTNTTYYVFMLKNNP